MSTIALYNKWRGQTFDDILGQEHITETLRNQIRAGRVGHAYLFTGLRGTGKTSTARILAKAVNCVGETDNPPCNACHICRSLTEGRSLDLIEIDGASNRGIDEIRDLRDRVNFAPNECRYKVYVIDEVHMLTKEAFNALLKTLEEPPEHVIFIMCTTEPHRLPDTVLSRCQRYDFRRGSVATIVAKLRRICEQEGINIADDALEYVARRATGSFRDAESLLDQLGAYAAENVTLEQVQAILGATPSALITALVQALVEGDAGNGLRIINQAFDGGVEPRQFLADILDHLRAVMLLVVGGSEDTLGLGQETVNDLKRIAALPVFSLRRITSAIRLFNEAGEGLRYAARAELPIELALVQATLPSQEQPLPTAQIPPKARPEAVAKPSAHRRPVQTRPASRPPTQAKTTPDRKAAAAPSSQERGDRTETTPPPAADAPKAASSETRIAEAHAQNAAIHETAATETASPEPVAPVVSQQTQPPTPSPDQAASQTLTLEWVLAHWQKVLMRVRSRNAQVQALLNSAKPVQVQGSTIVLACEAEFHREKLSQDKKQLLVEEVLSEVLETPCLVQCIVDARRQSAAPAPSGQAGALFETSESAPSPETELRNHPAVKELEKQGGVVTHVRLYDGEEEENRGKQG